MTLEIVANSFLALSGLYVITSLVTIHIYDKFPHEIVYNWYWKLKFAITPKENINKARLNVGDAVKVRKDLRKHDSINGCGIIREMTRFAGKTVTISEVRTFSNNVYIEGCHYGFDIEMFVQPHLSADEAFEAMVRGQISEERYEEIIRRERGRKWYSKLVRS